MVQMKQVNWFWSKCDLHNHKNVWLWLYDDEMAKHHYVNVGVMCMDDFGDLFVIAKKE
jgi:hypothetical protein